MSVMRECKDLAINGDVVDLAVACLSAAPFGKLVSSLVGDIVMALFGALLGELKFSSLAVKVGAASLAYGKFIRSCVDFFIIA